ncbi:hypothetical protein [Weissella confusa]|uniref:Uncharacterized protein n=1 Tax=Weissella confusa TaxID=1583 RepID=A0A4Z0RZS1_WEICO|nr:hypothetical protein [Weissella confusa]TGE73215.1 hypothetical protein C6P11_04815 [Weissella confusa]
MASYIDEFLRTLKANRKGDRNTALFPLDEFDELMILLDEIHYAGRVTKPMVGKMKNGVNAVIDSFQISPIDNHENNYHDDVDKIINRLKLFRSEYQSIDDWREVSLVLRNDIAGMTKDERWSTDKRRSQLALMSRLWTGFFGTERCRTPKIFQNPDFSLKRRHFSVFL